MAGSRGRASGVAILMVAILISFVFAVAGRAADGDGPRPLPSWAAIEEMLTRHFEALPDHQPGGILARSEVEALRRPLELLGWLPADWKSIVARSCPDESFLVQQLRTPAGRKLAAQVAEYPLGYDRIDRISRLPNGRRLVLDLVRGPDGYKLVQYMTTTAGGKNLGRQLANAPAGADFNKPTGRIYTLPGLLAELKTRYQRAKDPSPKEPAR